MEATQQPVTVRLLNDLNSERQRRISFETNVSTRYLDTDCVTRTHSFISKIMVFFYLFIFLISWLLNQLRSAEQKIQELDRDQLTLVDLLALEKSQREEEEKRLQMKLTVYLYSIFFLIIYSLITWLEKLVYSFKKKKWCRRLTKPSTIFLRRWDSLKPRVSWASKTKSESRKTRFSNCTEVVEL